MAAGAMLLPGFIDSHVHFLDGGFALASVQLRDAATPDEFASRIGAYAQTLAPGEWITNGDWDHENWGGELPQKGVDRCAVTGQSGAGESAGWTHGACQLESLEPGRCHC